MISTRLDRFGYVFLVLTIGIAILVPVLTLVAPKSSAFAMPPYLVALFGKYVCYALGGYAMGMYLMRQIGTRGVYANPILPDFMVFLNWHDLPVAWWGFNSFAYAGLMIVLAPGILAFLFGWFAFRSRVTGVYLSIITQALTYALKLAFFRNDFGFGGNNGLTDFKDILGFNVQSDATRATLFSVTALCLASRITNCSSGSFPPLLPASRVRSMCRRSASSTRASSILPIRSKPWSG
jgi:urea transport system permease protein